MKERKTVAAVCDRPLSDTTHIPGASFSVAQGRLQAPLQQCLWKRLCRPLKAFGTSAAPLLALAGWLGAPAPTHAQAPQYVVTDLGTLGGAYSVGIGINNFGQVTGSSEISVNGARHAFLYSSGSMGDLGTLGGFHSTGVGINNSGQVTGDSYINGVDTTHHCFLYSGGSMTDLGTLGGTDSNGSEINTSGQVTGFSDVTDDVSSHAFLYSSGSMSDLGTLGGTYSAGAGINDSGQVTGFSDITTGDTTEHAFLYSGGSMSDLGTLGGASSIGLDLNDSGQVTGNSEITGNSAVHAFLYSNGSMSDLGTIGGTYSYGIGINNSGQVTGDSFTTGDSASHAFLYSEGSMYDLNELATNLETSGFAELSSAVEINDNGWIVGYGLTSGGETHAFLATPVQTTPTPTPPPTPAPTPTPTPTPPPTPINVAGTIIYCSNPALNPVPNVTLTLTGTMAGSTLSDGSGNYTFSSLPSGGSYTVTPTKAALTPGTGNITTVDVIAVQKQFLTGTFLSGCKLAAADVTGDTFVTTQDVIAVQRFFNGFTSGIANTGKYQFTPANRTYPGIVSSQTGQNFDTLVFGDVAPGFVERVSGLPQTAAGDSNSAGKVPVTVAAVALPEVAVDQSKSNFIAAVKTSAVDPKNKLVGFQGDFTFDERAVTFQSEPVQRAGLTSGNWNVSGNVLTGAGPLRTLRISAFSNDFAPLEGSGTLFELRMTRVSKATQGTQLIWAAPPDHFIFIDADLNTQKPDFAASGGVTSSTSSVGGGSLTPPGLGVFCILAERDTLAGSTTPPTVPFLRARQMQRMPRWSSGANGPNSSENHFEGDDESR